MAPTIPKTVLFASGCIALAATGLISSNTAEYLVGSFGYYFVAGTFALWAWLGYSLLQCQKRKRPEAKRVAIILAVIASASYLSLALEPAEFKVVMDEPLLASTAQSMHHHRMALVPGRGVDVDGSYNLLEGFVDKRPLLYPFLVSVLHDLTGYRVTNAFVLNAILVPFFWLLIWSIGHSIRSKDSDGFLAIVLLSTAPLVSNLANSGGFDWINGCLLVFLFWVAQRFNRDPSSRILQGSLIATLGLLANTRYEGLLWALPFGVLLVARTGGLKAMLRLSWLAMLSPWMVLMPFVHRMVDKDATWQAGPYERIEKFSADYVIENVRSAIHYFFDMHPLTTASPLLLIVGLAGLIGIFVVSIKAIGECDTSGRIALLKKHAVWLVFAFGSALHTLLLMYFNWGFFQEYTVARLSFPLQISLAIFGTLGIVRSPRQTFSALVIVACGFIAYHFTYIDVATFLDTGLHRLLFSASAILGLLIWIMRRPEQLAQGITLIAVAFLALWSVSQISRHPYIGTHYPDREKFDMIQRFVDAHANERFLLVSDIPFLSILQEVPTVFPAQFANKIELARERILNQHAYAAVYYFQVFTYNKRSREWGSDYNTLEHPDLELELLETVFLGINKEARIFRVTIKPAEPETTDDGK